MTATIPDSHRDLLSEQAKAYAHLATVMDDGTPQVTPVWFDTEGELIRVIGSDEDRASQPDPSPSSSRRL